MMIKNRIEYGFILVIAALLFIFYHNFFFFYLLLVVSVLPFISYFVSKNIHGKIKAEMKISVGLVESGNEIPVDFTIDNPSFLPMPGIKLEFTAENRFYPNDEKQELNLPVRKGRHTYGWSVNSVYAGRVILRGTGMSMQDYLGLAVFKDEWNEEAAVSVIPGQSEVIMGAIENTFTEGDEQETDQGPTTEDVTQIKEFREYRPGDRLQRVHWKISNKYDELYVKEYEQEFNRTLTLLPELRRDREETGFLDELITAFYSAAIKLLDMGIQFHVQWYDSEHKRFCSELVNEEDSLIEVLGQMYMMKSYGGYPAFENYSEGEHRNQDLAIYFTSPSFSGYNPDKKIGTFKDRVILVCL